MYPAPPPGKEAERFLLWFCTLCQTVYHNEVGSSQELKLSRKMYSSNVIAVIYIRKCRNGCFWLVRRAFTRRNGRDYLLCTNFGSRLIYAGDLRQPGFSEFLFEILSRYKPACNEI